MVCNLTIGKAGYEAVQDEMQALLEKSEALRAELTAMIKADVEVFNRVMASYSMVKDTDQQKAERSAEIQQALKAATDVPLDCARACAEAIKLSRIAAEKGNTNVVSDAGVAVMAAYGALKSAALNVYINVGSIKDRDFADNRQAALEAILQSAAVSTEEVYQMVTEKL
jgi:formiminotetrahydrofolate cyclodeaminase